MKRTPFVFSVGIIALLLIAGGLLVWQKAVKAPGVPPTPTPPTTPITPTPTQPPTSQIPADWKTYTNTKYHYSFRYPPEYYIYQFEGMGVPETIDEDADNALIGLNQGMNVIFSIQAAGLKDLESAIIGGQVGNITFFRTNIAGQVAYKGNPKKNDLNSSDAYDLQTPNSEVIVIYVSIGNPIPNQILSSLKFTE